MLSTSVGAGSVPVTWVVSSATLAVDAATVGASLVPLMVMVRLLVAVPPWPSLTV